MKNGINVNIKRFYFLIFLRFYINKICKKQEKLKKVEKENKEKSDG